MNISDGIPHYIFEQVIFKYGILVDTFNIGYKNGIPGIHILVAMFSRVRLSPQKPEVVSPQTLDWLEAST